MDWLAWWNLLFELPLAAACMLSVATALGADASSESHHDAGVEHDVDHDVAVEHDVDHDVAAEHDVDHDVAAEHDVDHDVAAEHDVDHDADAHAEAASAEHVVADHLPAPVEAAAAPTAAGTDWIGAFLAIPGADRAPVTLVLMVLGLSFGFIGLFTNHLLSRLLSPYLYIWISLVVATAGGLVTSRMFARLFGRFLPRLETYVTSRRDCVGRAGTITALLSPRDGYAQLHDQHGNLLEMRVQAAEGSKFQQGSKILLIDYDEERGNYTASLFDPQAVDGALTSADAMTGVAGESRRAGSGKVRRRKERK